MRAALRRHLTDAMKARDRAAVAALRGALAAIENAEAVTASSPSGPTPVTSAHVAGGAAGVGSTDVARRDLTEGEVAGIVAAEVARLDDAAADYDGLGRPEEADDLRRQAAVLRGHLGPSD